MRVLLLSDTLSQDYGWGRYAVELIRALLRAGPAAGVRFRLLSPQHHARVPDLRDYPDHLPIASYRDDVRNLARLSLASLRQMRRAAAGCDLVHCITEPYAPLAWLGARGRPYFVTAHGTYAVRPLTRWPDRWLMAPAFRRAAGLLCVSEFTRRRVLEQLPLGNTVLLPEGVSCDRFQPPPEGPAPLPPALAGRRFVLTVGVVKRRKGLDTTLEAFARLRSAHPDLHYAIAGSAEDPFFLAELQRRVADHDLGARVHLLGRVTDETLLALYHGCEFFWLTPAMDRHQFEGFGLVYLEANACGKPVIGTLGSGAEEAIADGQTGFLVRPGDAAATAAAASRLLADPSLARRLGEQGRARARAMSWDRTAALLLDHFRRAVTEDGGRRPEDGGPRTEGRVASDG